MKYTFWDNRTPLANKLGDDMNEISEAVGRTADAPVDEDSAT